MREEDAAGPGRRAAPPGHETAGPRRPTAPTLREALDGLSRELEAAGLEAPRAEAERLLVLATGRSRSELQLSLASPLSPDEARTLADAVRRRISGEPLQHIEGTVAFRELVLVADARAFIPRPETEELVDRILAWAAARRTTRADTPGRSGREAQERGSGVRVVRRPRRLPTAPLLGTALDIGTGSGAIALSLVREGIAERVVALDRSAAALAQAAENRERAGLTGAAVELRRVLGSVWDAVRRGERFDLIVSNPPYVSTAEMADLPPDVRRDPPEALAGGENGLDVIREIVAGARERLTRGGALFLEIGEGQGASVRALLEASEPWARVEIETDLAGRERFAVACR